MKLGIILAAWFCLFFVLGMAAVACGLFGPSNPLPPPSVTITLDRAPDAAASASPAPLTQSR
jgi:hypothetical protein